MSIADEAQNRYGRKVSWGVQVAGEQVLFTHIAVPVMTRLKQPERQVLDTLVDAGVAGPAPTRWPGRSSWSVSTPKSGWPSCGTRCPRSTTCVPRAPNSKSPLASQQPHQSLSERVPSFFVL